MQSLLNTESTIDPLQSEASEDNISNVEDNPVTEEPIEVSDDAVITDNEVPFEAPQENNSEAVDQNKEPQCGKL